MTTLPCIACGASLDDAIPGAVNQPYRGLAFTSYGHYGGTVFDPMDGHFLEINVCDNCLLAAVGQREHPEPPRVPFILLGRDKKPILDKDGVTIGMEDTSQPLVPWTPREDK